MNYSLKQWILISVTTIFFALLVPRGTRASTTSFLNFDSAISFSQQPNVHIVLAVDATFEEYTQVFRSYNIPEDEWPALYERIQAWPTISTMEDEQVFLETQADCKTKWTSYAFCQRVYDTNEGDYDFRLVYRTSREGYSYIAAIYFYALTPQAAAALAWYNWHPTSGWWQDSNNFYPWYILGDEAMYYLFWNNCYAAGTQIGLKVTMCR
ncbi:MAG: hypothetical protein A3B74_02895 [Candidatus Kerfeldbacteria bacterium RIFCSPHIGHO2_02_FULL_42_14]|uniref:Uncharacterized protein n=1 Tax=Candidatus Kerfeldbacteria bacterium RIFCSPHIGHO2_02_FULL_42_14 TaxID=1798540 RepID=A0A1G2AV32_9BACT|nr:MAG: hypothetical protein A3B74_02895 [Candidatus Kerfeldbacteria bacterium RIFCSPHIGHO2_02_FULL_42_14]OGY82358.1 MAG: hypothetical protein A3E60_00285 [Candidatus Kerfeldbacteria bacterium RIFCSPHIGHO2_12_FULL_42_13]OGY84590.1 MAG: hypothetical protein A3I91_01205 [Candidatus Kerfeldbacteria bacterium RIFCSPLOWO2_02_FULL_42_19]OGY87089.1 MAG: hypothetical protein A3G01_04280 [Candidatus Kerfeldbacteria bacterium RIFCSPLOWO2_12_FULL_43_9]